VTDQQHELDMAAQIEAELARLRVADVLLHTASTVASLAYRRLAEEEPDLDQVRLAIESLRALVPLLEGAVPESVLRDFRQVTANLQLAYAAAVPAGD
jgi:hypothetical protein